MFVKKKTLASTHPVTIRKCTQSSHICRYCVAKALLFSQHVSFGLFCSLTPRRIHHKMRHGNPPQPHSRTGCIFYIMFLVARLTNLTQHFRGELQHKYTRVMISRYLTPQYIPTFEFLHYSPQTKPSDIPPRMRAAGRTKGKVKAKHNKNKTRSKHEHKKYKKTWDKKTRNRVCTVLY